MKEFLKCIGIGAFAIFGTGLLCYIVGYAIFPAAGESLGNWQCVAQSILGLCCLVAAAVVLSACYLIGSDILHPSDTDYTPR